MIDRMMRVWRGEESLARTFWLYAIFYGTLANILATVGTFAAVAANAPVWLALMCHLLPLPYNIFIAFAVWRSAELFRGPHEWAMLARAAVIVWALIASVA